MRKSIAYFGPSPNQTEHVALSFYGHMIIEDIQHGVSPYDGVSRSAPKVVVVLTPMSREAEDIIRYAFPHQGYLGHNMKDVISNFIRECAMRLAYEGVAHFEIVRGPDMDLHRYERLHRLPDLPVDQLFRPDHIPGTVLKFGARYIQLVPKHALSNEHRWYPVIPAKDVWTVSLPQELGNRRTHHQFLRKLRDASTSTPPFVLDSMQKQADFSEFNSSAYYKTRDEFVARQTAALGWSGRWSWDKLTLEYFRIYRHMRFARAMAVLRLHILDATNKLLQRVNFPSRVTITGLPAASDIDNAMAALHRGDYSFEKTLAIIGL